MKIGYTKGSHYFVNFYYYIAKLMNWGHHSVVQSIQCDIFFYSFLNVKDAQRCKKGTRLVFVSGECWDTTRFPCSLLIDCKNTIHPRCPTLYYPFYALSLFERNADNSGTQLIKSPTFNARAVLSQKTKFCAFMYSYDVDFRVKLYDDINSYKPVDALGKSRNVNRHLQTDRGNVSYMNSAVEKYKPYKFVICCENKKYPGYVTEKIMNAMLAQSIPIYYGDPNVAIHFNPKSFIDISSFQTRAAAIEFIRRVDQDDELYCSILNEPWYHNNTPSKYFDPAYVQEVFQTYCKTKGNNNNNNNNQIQQSTRTVQRYIPVQRTVLRSTSKPTTRRSTTPMRQFFRKQPMFSIARNHSRRRSSQTRQYLTRRTNQTGRRGFKKDRRRMALLLTKK